ncbi:MAG: hypothetical protein JWQ57_1597, partial [Mucilaginibacter sp.]|nr:hypothetical protein [Mucilaginibacter sp.]
GIVHMMSDTLKVNSGTLQDIIFKGNVIWNTQALPYLFLNINKDASSNLTMASDYNFYHSPLTFDKFFFLKQLFASGAADKTVYNLHTWGGAFGRDINSRDKMPMGLNYGYTLNTPAKVTQSFFDSNGNIAPSGLPGTIRTQSNCDFSKDDIKLGSGALTVTPHDPTKLTTFYINLGDTTSDPDDVQYIITFNITGSQDGFLFIDIDRTFKLDIGRINVVETKVSATSNVCLMKNNVTAPAQLLQITIPIGVGAITINNLNVYTGTLTPPDISNLRFECNPTPSQASITLDQNYYDAAYNFYPAGDFTMEPFSSLILTPAVSAVIKM